MKISFSFIFQLFFAHSYGYALKKELHLKKKSKFHISNSYLGTSLLINSPYRISTWEIEKSSWKI